MIITVSYIITNTLYLLTLVIFLRKLLSRHASDSYLPFQLVVNIIYCDYKLMMILQFNFHCAIICVLNWKHKPLNTNYFYKVSINPQNITHFVENWQLDGFLLFSTNQWHLVYSIYVTAAIRVITAYLLILYATKH